MPRAIAPDPGVLDQIGTQAKPWYKGWFVTLFKDGVAVHAGPIDASFIASGILDPTRIEILLATTALFNSHPVRTLFDISSDAALGAQDPAARINAGDTFVSGTKIQDGTLSPQALNAALALAQILLLSGTGALQSDNYEANVAGLHIGADDFNVNTGSFGGLLRGIIEIGQMMSDALGNLTFGAADADAKHGILADGREFWGSTDWASAPVQFDKNGDVFIADSPQSKSIIDLGAINAVCLAPIPSVAGGQFNGDLTITAATRGSTIYYTSDGSDPTVITNGARTKYTAPIHIALGAGQTLTIRAYAIKLGVASPVSQWVFTGDASVVSSPTATPLPGSYFNRYAVLDVTLMSGTAGATIIVTTDGTDPTDANGFVLVGAVHLTQGKHTIKAFAKKAGLISSAISVFNYDVEKGTNSTDGSTDGGGGSDGGGGHSIV